MRRRTTVLAISIAAAILTVSAALSADAQPWPAKPIHVIVPLTAGSATDVIPRIVFGQVSAQLGQPIVVENRVGGGGSIGAGAVAKAEPDGYTILVHSNAHTVAPAVLPNLPYDVIKDFAGITPLGNVPNVLVISPAKNIKTVRELVAAAKAKPGSINFASGGTGTPPHLTAERFRMSAGFEGQHIPFKGAPEALTEVLSGRVDFYFLADRAGDALHPRRQAPSARGQQHQAVLGSAGGADDGGSGLPQLRLSISISGCGCRRRRRAISSRSCTRRP